MSCPHCQDDARFVDHRAKSFVSLVGDIRFRRAYYHCEQCQQGFFPWDATLRLPLQRLTPGAEEVASLSFGKAAERTLRKMAGIRLCESTVERTTEAAGERLGLALSQGQVFGEKAHWEWNRDSEGKTCAHCQAFIRNLKTTLTNKRRNIVVAAIWHLNIELHIRPLLEECRLAPHIKYAA